MSKVGDVLEGTVVRVYPRYLIMLFEDGETGLLHISELSKKFVTDLGTALPVGSICKVKVIEIDEETHSMRVSKKRLNENERRRYFKKKKIAPTEIDFSALYEALPNWIREENSNQ